MTAFVAVNWLEIKASEARLRGGSKASEARLNKRIDELREEMKELRADSRALGEKMDRLLEALPSIKQT